MKYLLMFLTISVTTPMMASEVYRVGECVDGDCTQGTSRVVIVDQVKNLRDRDVKVGLCFRDKNKVEGRVEEVNDVFFKFIKHVSEDDVIEYKEIMKTQKEYSEILADNIPVPCQDTIFGDDEYMEACQSNSKRWARKNFCLDRDTLRRQKLYGL